MFVRTTLGIDTDTGKPVYGESSSISDSFSHSGFKRGSRPDNLGKELDAITEIHVVIKTGAFLEAVYVMGKLLSTDTFVEE